MAQKMNGAQLIARMLKAYGVTHVFFMDAILRRALAEMEDVGITRILGHSEKAVAYMADGLRARVGPARHLHGAVGGRGQSRGRHAGPLPRPLGGDRADRTPCRAVPVSQRLPGSRPRSAVRGGDQVSRQDRHAGTDSAFAATGVPRSHHRHAAPGAPRHRGLYRRCLTPLEGMFDIVADEAHTRFPAFRPAPDPTVVQRAAAAIKTAARPVIVADRGVDSLRRRRRCDASSPNASRRRWSRPSMRRRWWQRIIRCSAACLACTGAVAPTMSWPRRTW